MWFAVGMAMANMTGLDLVLQKRIIPEWCIQRDNLAGQTMEALRVCQAGNQGEMQSCVGAGQQCEQTLEACRTTLGKLILQTQDPVDPKASPPKAGPPKASSPAGTSPGGR
jgi:hypothetical protein